MTGGVTHRICYLTYQGPHLHRPFADIMEIQWRLLGIIVLFTMTSWGNEPRALRREKQSELILLTTELLHIPFKVWNIFSAFRHLSVKVIIITPQKMLIVPNLKIEQASIGER